MYSLQQTQCIVNINKAFDKAESIFGRTLPRPKIEFSNRMKTCAGKAIMNLRDETINRIVISNELLTNNPEHIINQTTYHEAAHIIDRIIYGNYSHGSTWKGIMAMLGKNPDIYHSLIPSNRTPMYCKCKTHHVTKSMYNKCVANRKFICNQCKTPLSIKMNGH